MSSIVYFLNKKAREQKKLGSTICFAGYNYAWNINNIEWSWYFL